MPYFIPLFYMPIPYVDYLYQIHLQSYRTLGGQVSPLWYMYTYV